MIIICSVCGQEKKHKAKQMCLKCYAKFYNQTETGKKRIKKYITSEKGILHRKRYRQTSEKYKKYNSNYMKEYLKEYRRIHKKEAQRYMKKYQQTEKYKLYRKEYSGRAVPKLINNIRNLIRISFKNQGFKKNTKTESILGCSFEEFKQHLESQFTPEMNLQNHGKVWEIDHIVPVSYANTKEQVIKLNHYKNLRPLIVEENRTKKDKLPENIDIKLQELIYG